MFVIKRTSVSLSADARISATHHPLSEPTATHHKRPRLSGSVSSQSTGPPDTPGVISVANDVAALPVVDGMDGGREEILSIPSADHLEVTKTSTLENGRSALAITSGEDLRTGGSASGTADDVPTVLHATGSFEDNVNSVRLSMPSSDTGLQVAALSAKSVSRAGDIDDDEGFSDGSRGDDSWDATYFDEDNLPQDILPLKQMREDALKLFPPEELEPDFIPVWFSEDQEESYRKKITDLLSPVVIDERSWFLLRNHLPFHFVSSQIVLLQLGFCNLLL